MSLGMDSIPAVVKEISVVDTGKFLSTTAPPSTIVVKVTCGSVGELLGALVSVGASVGGSLGASVGKLVGASVGQPTVFLVSNQQTSLYSPAQKPH